MKFIDQGRRFICNLCDGFPVPDWPNHGLSSPAKPVHDAELGVACSFHFAPLTPDQARQLEHQRHSERLNVSLDECSSQEKDKGWNVVASTSGETENHSNEFSQIIVDSATPAIPNPLKGKNNFKEEDDQRIDLNKTPELKTPKRRKHRPKVVIEGKSKRVPKTSTPKSKDSSDNPSGKRKYVRKKSLKTPESQQDNVVNDVALPSVESSRKSCRRALNFDLETGTRDAIHDLMDSHRVGRDQENKRPFNLNLDAKAGEISTGTNSITRTSAGPMEQCWQLNKHTEKDQQAKSTCNPTCSANQKPLEHRVLNEQCAPPMQSTKGKDHTLNVVARNLNMRNTSSGEDSWRNGYNQLHQLSQREEINQDIFGACSSSENFHIIRRQLMLQNATQLVMTDMDNFNEKRGLKRAHGYIVEQIHPQTCNVMASPILNQENLGASRYSCSSNIGTISSHINKKLNPGSGLHATALSASSCINVTRDCSRQAEAGGMYYMHANNDNSQNNCRLSDPCIERDSTCKKPYNAVNGTASNWCIPPTPIKQDFQKQHTTKVDREQMAGKVHQLDQRIKTADVSKSRKDQTAKPAISLNQGLSTAVKVIKQQQSNALEGYQQNPKKERGKQRKQKLSVLVEEVILLLENLHINDRLAAQEEHALVPYNGSSTIVPYEGFDNIKKRKPRPKVDLDPETDRIWKLLMGSEGSESAEAAEKDKEKWWEEERKVFRGRADSFIARMHLVQGDRRFSRWKGSVVDSVIGVFLTQNVSDHLSSSAFMSLAARFPLQSTVVEGEPDIQVLESVDKIKNYQKIGLENIHNLTYCKQSDHTPNNLTSGTNTASNVYNRISDIEFSLSLNTFYPLNSQTSKEIMSSLKSDSQTKDQRTGFNPNMNYHPAKNMFQTEPTIQKDFYSHVNGSLSLDGTSTQLHQQSENSMRGRHTNLIGSGVSPYPINSHILDMQEPILSYRKVQTNVTPVSGVKEKFCSELPGEQSLPSFSTTHSEISAMGGVNLMSRWMSSMAESKTSAQPNGGLSAQTTTLSPFVFMNNLPTQQSGQPEYDSQFTINYKMENPKYLERAIVTKEAGPSTRETERISRQDTENCLGNIFETNVEKLIHSSVKSIDGTTANISPARKGKIEAEKKKTFDWDSLRKKVQSNGKRGRSKETMDSLNYEAVRHADVSEISNAIKERGMNNMLADRIKDFLNRLVNDHGSVDLEWLRDVPPDKAKDYLLSVRGLGLKSVECVRLLTLHQLAFPVDTNVGRIAVRLGWVPLQPLPESLQLHLLELYPILESIQKYLWPRLCKLDQQTLYELHYQMITFGKVFCTKSKPNCNACPMRGECRHFASAFASARLALPGPEERSIVSSAVPIATDTESPVSVKPIPLIEAQKDPCKEAGDPYEEAGAFSRKYEPIIEEPTTPEQERTELLESDIEDAFYEDPDEIPTIQLNVEEFTMNLQNYMQDNMELQEGDMSRALVALNPEVASIPTPKLKNVSRLRTEHQVYELPDSHPLLKGMDEREPDDPSPYLLAIWTPGETANSIQPPESRCQMQESGQLCNDRTCFICNSTREENSQTVRGTLLIPCRTATRGSFPLNGTYFQVNEMFADHESSLNPIDVPRSMIWNLPRRTVYFGTSVTSIFKGLPTEGIQYCFWRGFVCVRGFDQKRRAPRPLMARLHFTASKLVKTKK